MGALHKKFRIFTEFFHDYPLSAFHGKYYSIFRQKKLDSKFLVTNPSSFKTESEGSDDHQSLNIAVIGVPNTGKSSFINNITNHRVCPVSSKVHTTRKANKAIYTNGETQLVFHDTPGLVTQQEVQKHKLEKEFVSAFRYAIQNSDIIAVLHDVSNSWTRKSLHTSVIEALKMFPNKPSVLVLNKIDVLKSKRILLDLVQKLTNNKLQSRDKKMKPNSQVQSAAANNLAGWDYFEDVFMISAATGTGLNEILNYFMMNAKKRPWEFSKHCLTNQSPEMLIEDSVKARLLDYLPQEIPYNLKTCIEYYSEEYNTIYASVMVTCPSERIERLICGESNGKLFQITERVTSDLVETFGKAVSLTIATTL